MLRRYIRERVQQSRQLRDEELLERAQACESDADLLTLIQATPVEAIRTCHDSMGNTLLHVVLSRHKKQKKKLSVDLSEDIATKESAAPVSRWGDRFRRQAPPQPDTPPAAEDNKNAFLKAIQYLVHCTDPEIETNEVMKDSSIIHAWRDRSRYNSLVRIKCVSGSLPLHTACRCLVDSCPQQLDVIQYLLQSYPIAVQTPDVEGNLPLHDACDVACPLEIIIALVQQFPDTVKIPNVQGDLPLHLVAGASVQSKPERSKSADELRKAGSGSFDEMDVIDLCDANADYSPPAWTNRNKLASIDSDACETPFTKVNPSRLQQQLDVVMYLCELYPESTQETNKHGQTALQKAQEADFVNEAVVLFLLEAAERASTKSAPIAGEDTVTVGAINVSPVRANPNSGDAEDADDSSSNVLDYEAKDESPHRRSNSNPFDDDRVDVETSSAEIAEQLRRSSSNPFDDGEDADAILPVPEAENHHFNDVKAVEKLDDSNDFDSIQLAEADSDSIQLPNKPESNVFDDEGANVADAAEQEDRGAEQGDRSFENVCVDPVVEDVDGITSDYFDSHEVEQDSADKELTAIEDTQNDPDDTHIVDSSDSSEESVAVELIEDFEVA